MLLAIDPSEDRGILPRVCGRARVVSPRFRVDSTI